MLAVTAFRSRILILIESRILQAALKCSLQSPIVAFLDQSSSNIPTALNDLW